MYSTHVCALNCWPIPCAGTPPPVGPLLASRKGFFVSLRTLARHRHVINWREVQRLRIRRRRVLSKNLNRDATAVKSSSVVLFPEQPALQLIHS
jgi:hypothetical protein